MILRTDKAKRYRDTLAVDLGESASKQTWEMPNIEDNPSAPQTRVFDRLSEWCVEVAASQTLTASEKRQLTAEQYDKYAMQVKFAEQEKILVKKQMQVIMEDLEFRKSVTRDMEGQIEANRDLLVRGVDALRELVQKDIELEYRGRRQLSRAKMETEENIRMGMYLINNISTHERQKIRVKIEARKQFLLSQNQSQFEQDLQEARKQQRDVVEQTMRLMQRMEDLDKEILHLNDRLDDLVSRIKEFETLKKRVAEGINRDILIHRQIQKEILDELKKEADYHMYVHNLIDSVSDEIEEKQRKINEASSESKGIEQKLVVQIDELNEKIETAKAQKLELFQEIKSMQRQRTKMEQELTSNQRWAEEYKQRLALLSKED